MKAPATEAAARERNRAAFDRAKADPAATLAALRMLWRPGDATHDTTGGKATPTPAYRIAWFLDAFGPGTDAADLLAFLHDRRGGAGLSLLAWGVERMPQHVHPERRCAGRLPARLAQVADGFGRSGDVLPRLAGGGTGGATQYSLIPQLGGPVDEYGGEWLASALPVELYTTRGRGAPLDIRLGLEAILSVRPEDRRGRPVPLGPWPWKRWLERIYPGWGRRTASNAGKAWPGLARALESLRTDSRWWLPVSNGMGGWEAVHVVAPILVPLTGHPSERVMFAVTLDSTKHGAVTDRRLIREAGAKSTAALGLASGLPLIWDRPGDLRAKVGHRWEQNADPRAYPLIGTRGVVSLMYPGGPPKRKRWPQLAAEALALLEWLAERGYVTWTREPGGRRIMPGADWPGWRPEQRTLIGPPK